MANETPNTPEDEPIYGFGESDADQLASMINRSGSLKPGQRRQPQFNIICCKTGGSGIAAASTASVTYRPPTSTSWTDSTDPYIAYNIHPTVAVAANTIILIAPVNGRWVVIWEACP